MDRKELDTFYDSLAEQAKEEGKAQLNQLLEEAKADGLEFVRRQGELLQKYLLQLATGEITRDEFKSYVMDMKTLSLMEIQRQGVAGQASIQRYLTGLTRALIEGLFRLL